LQVYSFNPRANKGSRNVQSVSYHLPKEEYVAFHPTVVQTSTDAVQGWTNFTELTDAAPGSVNAGVVSVGFDRLKVPRTDDVETGDALAAGGDTFLLRVGVVRRRTAYALEVHVAVAVCT